MSAEIQQAKQKLPLPALMHRLGLGEHAKKSARCPFHDDQRNSFSVYKNGSGEFRFKCFAGCGEGDEITFLEKNYGISNKEATKLFLEMGGANGATPTPRKATSASTSKSTSPLDWRACVKAFSQKHLERLAKWRGYSIELCAWLKEAALVGLYDARIAFPVHDRGGNVVAVHYRLKDGSWRYFPQGVMVRPLVIGELVPGDTVHVFESYWDAFAFIDKSGERHGIIITRGASNGALVADVIPQDAKVYLWTQNDAAAEKWQSDICANTKATVKHARIPAAHKDLNDWTRAGASTDDLSAAMVNAEVVEEAETSDKRHPLTIRTIGEILEMRFDDAELLLTNGYLALGERTAMCGMGGVGKSRLIMQLALCSRARRDFLGWETRRPELRWLFLQTENSNRRLKYDLGRMLTAFTSDEQEAIKAGIFFHTLEADDDGFLMLDAENSERIVSAIAAVGADLVVYDPLRDFGSDDLNSDRYMTETLREISRITKRGNPKRIPLIIHHAGTGKAGILKATGFDRSSFGRNSKVLFSWVRAQINVAPGSADDNNMIVICSAKCSNAKEFEPFAAALNEETMLYSRDEHFDLDAWQRSLASPRGAADKLNIDVVIDLLPLTGSIPKAVVIERLRDKGIGEKRSREFISANLAPLGPVHEWHIKRSGKRDEVHLSREPQPDIES
jgi:hypothetical protein